MFALLHNSLLHAAFDPDHGPSPADKAEIRAEKERQERARKAQAEQEAKERAEAARRKEKRRRMLKQQKISAAVANAEMVVCQKRLAEFSTELGRPVQPGEAPLIAHEIARDAEAAGRPDLRQAALQVGEMQKASTKDFEKAMKYVCRYDPDTRGNINAAAKERRVREEYSERLNEIAWEGIVDINLALISNPVAQKVIAGIRTGLAPEITFGDIGQSILDAGNAVVGLAITPFVAPSKMLLETICLELTIRQIAENAKQRRLEEIRKEADEFQRAIQASYERSRDHRWNRDPGWLDFIGRHANIV